MKNLVFILLVIIVSNLTASIINIPEDQPTIQEGINVTADGDTVLVHPGTYYENINYNGNNITIASQFLTTQDTSFISQTSIDGNQNGSVVTFGTGEDNSALLSGFTITNGQSQVYGSGISCIDASPTLSNLKVLNNHFSSWGIGGGINFLNSTAVLENIKLINNSAQFGGGFFGEDSQLEITNLTCIGNESYNGGAICLLQAEVTIYNALIHGNYTSNEGGAIWTDRSDLNLINATISDNSVLCYGGGIYLIWSSYINLINCVFLENYPEDICFTYDSYYPNSTMNITHNNFAGGEDGIVTNNNGFLNMLEGNIYLDPEFVGIEDFHLQDSSPCIGSGIDQILIAGVNYQAPEFDLNGNPRPVPAGSMPDIGVYENPLGNPQVGITNGQLLKTNFYLSNYPNPFNPTTTIEFSIQNDSIIELSIYNLKGQIVKTLINNEVIKGNHLITWNGDDHIEHSVSSGVYYYELKVNGKTEAIQRCLLLK
jgi:hypothetical protein